MSFVAISEIAAFADSKMHKTNFFDCPQMVADVYGLEPGQQQKIHSHEGEAKLYYVVSGRGDFTIGDETRTLGPGLVAAAAPGEPHGVNNPYDERLTVLVVMAPNPNLRSTS